jgi:CRISPR-associated protein Cst1
MARELVWTGHPLVDAGAAGIAAFCHKYSLGAVDEEDIRQAADFVEAHYPQEPFKSFLASIFPNSGYVNPTMGEEKRRAFLHDYLRAYELPTIESQRCIFCGKAAQARAFREHIPLTMGRDMINFVPNGVSGLPVCGYCLLSIQAVPLAGLRCEGRLLVVHSVDADLTLAFADRFFQESQRMRGLVAALPEGERKMAGARFARTILMRELEAIEAKRHASTAGGGEPSTLTAYHFTNYGAGPDIAIYHLPLQVARFLRIARQAKYYRAWEGIVRRAWENRSASGTLGRSGEARNSVYESLFSLPDNATTFLRRYFLRRKAIIAEIGESSKQSSNDELGLISWDLTTMFLREVVNMDKERRDMIADVGSRIAAHIERENDRKLLQAFLLSKRYAELRWRLVRASLQSVKRTGEPLISLDEFVTLFEYGEDVPRPDWGLARDLLLIRIIEILRTWLQDKPEVVNEALAVEEERVEEEEAIPV